jgi:hypothetical protein
MLVALVVPLSLSIGTALLWWPAPDPEPPADPGYVVDEATPLASIHGGERDGESVFDAIDDDYRTAIAQFPAPPPERFPLAASIPPGMVDPFTPLPNGGYIVVADYGAQLASLAWLCAWEHQVRVSVHEGDGVGFTGAVEQILRWPDFPVVQSVLADFLVEWNLRIGDRLRAGDETAADDDVRATCANGPGQLVVPPVGVDLEDPVSLAYRQTLAAIPLTLPGNVEVASEITDGYGESMTSGETGMDGEFGAYVASMAWLCAWELALVDAENRGDPWTVRRAATMIAQWPTLEFVRYRMQGQVQAWTPSVAVPLRAGNEEVVVANTENTCSRLPPGLVSLQE